MVYMTLYWAGSHQNQQAGEFGVVCVLVIMVQPVMQDELQHQRDTHDDEIDLEPERAWADEKGSPKHVPSPAASPAHTSGHHEVAIL
jgi:hypothetical protein